MTRDDEQRTPSETDPRPILDYSTPRRPVNLVTIATFPHSWEVHLAAGKIENAGIDCVVIDENSAMGAEAVTGIGGVKLQVREEDAEETVRVLKSKVVSDENDDPDAADDEYQATEGRRSVAKWAFMLLVLIPAAVLLLLLFCAILAG